MQKSIEELVKVYNSSISFGLGESDIEISKEKYGRNVLEEKKKKSLFVRFLEQFTDALIIVLLASGVVSIIVDPSEWVDSLIIFIVIIVNAILGVVQEARAEKSLDALKKLSTPTCKVIRNGKVISIDTKELVVGDIIEVEAGDFIPADARIIECSNLKVDESALTGESVSVLKNDSNTLGEVHGLGDMKNCLFSSTFVTNGKAKAIVTSVGMKTEIGKIATSLMSDTETKTPLQNKLTQVGKIIGLMCIIICIVVFVLNIISGSSILDAFKIAVSLAVAAIPEGLATVVTIVLAIGVDKMSKHNAIVKRLPAVETLGSTSVICSDKTGTLTKNKMTVVKIYKDTLRDLINLSSDEKELLNFFASCCDASISIVDGKQVRLGDPTELALLDANINYASSITYERLMELPFDSDRKLMSVVIKYKGKYLAITKGAPDIIVSISNDNSNLSKALIINDMMSKDAIRVLGLGVKEFDYLPKEEELEKDLTFLGLIGMIDPARDEVKDAIKIAHDAGITTVMITGDQITTASSIAKKLGIMSDGDLAITSKDLNLLSDSDLLDSIEKYKVYARVSPSDKVRIVSAWEQKGYITAMTGDGVNDAPALKKASIGCAMGINGTDVSKEAADMILTDDNYTTIVEAVRQGRCIFDNIRKCVKYLLSSNIGEVITIFVASVLSLIPAFTVGVPLAPIHLLWINLITDSLPAFGLGMEKPDDDIMKRNPRKKTDGFFSDGLLSKIIMEGLVIGLLTLFSYLVGNNIVGNHTVGQTMAFLTLSSTQLFHSYNVKSNNTIFSRSTFDNKFLNLSFVIGFILQLLVIYIPGVNTIFKFTYLSLGEALIAIGLAFIMVIVMEITKIVEKLENSKKN